MKRILSAFLILVALGSWISAAPLDPVLTSSDLWTQTPETFMAAGEPLGFEWTSAAKDSARAAVKDMTAFGQKAVECVARFEGGALKQMTVVFYARGDAGEISETQYDTLVRTSCEALNTATQVKFAVRGKDQTSAVKAEGLVWTTPTGRYLLEYSKVREIKSIHIPFRAEFVRLEMTPPEKKLGLAAQILQAPSGKFIGSEHVKRDPATGDVWIGDVPMVDQGQKGYCVVAATERVMRYYGNPVDANELAQVANSSAAGGTSYDAMYEALKKLSTRLKVRVHEIEKTDYKDVVRLMADYNRNAKRYKMTPIPDQGNMISLSNVYEAMDGNVLKETRTKNPGDLTRFERSLEEHVNRGTPLLWTVMLGKIPEKGVSANAGGHMRLLIGYNAKTSEVLFSDTWGAGHELKRMPLADAYTMTTGTMSIEPMGT
ncbi:MAG: hypothetical protein ABIT76_14465 [Chthoniobacterales bacterium]